MGICSWDTARHLEGSRQHVPRLSPEKTQGFGGAAVIAKSVKASVEVKLRKEILEISTFRLNICQLFIEFILSFISNHENLLDIFSKAEI